ncbi:proline-specific permease-like protein [Cucurbitaria berberidis CBS 394.84]|uniref:Proline-specific permease-like protein n=1 Tax=Cucurbitaria berberidis CBS 394.84 TaxID=1168544 RepID=A0A9P4G7E5_9PLEO|nr:proline-specific permease-like protein [Cucurbitaria berberidis CBS 394.84]KAF1840423.1 proline-specific permease-like protein [Cucurbitaria berberidis CBS 394.84]
MPNHHIVDGRDPEKGHTAAPYGYEKEGGVHEEPFVHGAATVAEASGQGGETHRGLKSRHIQFLALGGAIGTGLFIGSGAILALVGPAPLFMAYLSMMIVVWNVMNNLAEIVTYLPMKGITIPYFIKRFVDPSLAFATGWNYWYAYAVLVAAEATAGAILLEYWETPVHKAVWITIFLLVILVLNIVAVEVFGEAEFWFASIKFITIMGLVILGFVIMLGGSPNDQGRLGFRYWNNPGAFTPFIASGNSGRFLAFWTAFVRAGFAFITSPELIALSAGETIAPRRNIPKAAGRFVYRLAIFYGFGSFIIGVIVPSDDPRLLSGKGNASASPFVIGIQRAGIVGLNHVVNAAVLTSAWSAGNAFLFSGSRVLYGMALNGEAPKFFGKTSKKGVPYFAVLATWGFGLLAYLNVSNSGARVFQWFSNISTISGFIAWIVVMITYIRFRKAMVYNNMLSELPYRTRFQPYATYVVLGVVSLLTITNGFHIFVPSRWSVSDFLAAYITLPIFLVLYVGHKIWFRTPFAIKIEHIDVMTGKKEMDELCKNDISGAPVPKNIFERVWFWIA